MRYIRLSDGSLVDVSHLYDFGYNEAEISAAYGDDWSWHLPALCETRLRIAEDQSRAMMTDAMAALRLQQERDRQRSWEGRERWREAEDRRAEDR